MIDRPNVYIPQTIVAVADTMIPYGSLVVFATPRGKKYLKRVEEGNDWQTSEGILKMEDVAASDFGKIVYTSRNWPVRLEEATLPDRIMGIKRQTQIIYPKDIAWLCLKLGAGPGRTIVEAGCGSGGLTLALSWYCGATGRVISHDARPEFVRLARRNLDWAGLGANVELYCRDIAGGFEARDADALFLDVREPWLYLVNVVSAIKPGAMVAFLLPTSNQVADLLLGLEKAPFGEIEVDEILMRQWKPLADRLRPADRMTAHTGFLVFCRQQQECRDFDDYGPRGTRERKQLAAREAREADND